MTVMLTARSIGFAVSTVNEGTTVATEKKMPRITRTVPKTKDRRLTTLHRLRSSVISPFS